MKFKNIKCNVNYESIISQINDQEMLLTDQSMNAAYNDPIKFVQANIIHGYCRNGHSLPASSISREITIC